MNVVLISTYELGRQPFGLASPAAWLRLQGHTVTCVDLAVGSLPMLPVREANLVAFYLPMHTATRLAVPVIDRVRRENPNAHICCYGLYAPVNEAYLRSLGVGTIIGGEFEASLTRLAAGASFEERSVVSLERLSFLPPDRTGLPVLARYPKLVLGDSTRKVGYTESSRGCKHLCRHCPVVPVYNGAFRVVQADAVLEDIRRQAAAGAEHISFGDPDFLNGPAHARRIMEALHREFPDLTWDATIKVEHLLQHQDMIPAMKDNGCLFVITAAESVEDHVLDKLQKGHTAANFLEVVALFRNAGLALSPTFVPFTPWTTIEGYRALLDTLVDQNLVDSVPPVQLSLRMLIPSGSRLLELDDIRAMVEQFDPAGLVWRWQHPDPRVDELSRCVLSAVHAGTQARKSRREIFRDILRTTGASAPENLDLLPRTVIPYMEEPWFC